MHSYAARAAAFAVAYVAIFWATAQSFGPYLFLLPPIAVGTVWLAAQARFGLRRLDLIALATAGAVGASLEGAGLFAAAVVAVWATVPPLMFTVLLQQWLPGYWLGHGDRFRRSRASFAKLTAAAALTAAAGLVLAEVSSGGTPLSTAAVHFLRDTVVIVLATLTVRALRRARPSSSDAGREARVIVLR